MEKKIVVSKRFRKNTSNVYDYLLEDYSAKTAFDFLDKLQRRVELIIRYPEIGKPSRIRPNVRSVTLQPDNRFFTSLKLIALNYFACLT